ncbi:MAG: Tm-1-like ATP-binding domain-containing protein [Chloroflexi bacterium]|nr:Tm-1-like ATP-binding domain-containing protein [Chloroflexota bacterium]
MSQRTIRRIAVLATLDTKAQEARFVADCIRRRGHEPWLVDLGIAGEPAFAGDTPREAVAEAAGTTVAAIGALQRAEAMEAAAVGAARLVQAMVGRGEVQTVLGIGGGTGTWLGTTVMRALPLGFPKLMVSTLGSRDGTTDIMVMPSVADVSGVNRLLGPILANAACAACGMAEGTDVELDTSRPTIALTMFGVTTRGGTLVRQFLEAAGCEVVVFHANGTGGRTMEDLVARGAFAGVLDWTTSEVTDEIAGGICTAGPDRLEAAAAHGVPQVVVPGAVDVINIHGAIPRRFARRTSHMHLPNVPLIRTSVRESREIGAFIARKLNAARGPVRVLIPEGGYSTLDVTGGPFEDRKANAAFVAALRADLRPEIPVEVLPDHINSEAFARAAAEAMLALVGRPSSALAGAR